MPVNSTAPSVNKLPCTPATNPLDALTPTRPIVEDTLESLAAHLASPYTGMKDSATFIGSTNEPTNIPESLAVVLAIDGVA